jgi:hypothetical protein
MTFTRRWAEMMAEQGGPALGLADLPRVGPVSLQWWSDVIHEDGGRLEFGARAHVVRRCDSAAQALRVLPSCLVLAAEDYGEGVLMMCSAATGDVVGGPWEVGG